MTRWAWVSQFGLAGFASLLFLTIVADDLERADRELAGQKRAWDREQRRRLGELSNETFPCPDATILRPPPTDPQQPAA